MLAQSVQFVSTLPAGSPEALYAEYEILMARVIRSRVRADGRGKGRQGQILQQAQSKYAEWQKALNANKQSYMGSLLQASVCTKCSFPIAQGQTRSILGDAHYHLECDPSPWAEY